MNIKYYQLKIPKNSGGFRTLDIPCDELKQKQREILAQLYDLIPIKMGMYIYEKGRRRHISVVKNASKHRGSRGIVKLDIYNCFARTRQDKLKAVLGKLADHHAALKPLLDDIYKYCFLNGRLPTGAPTSPALMQLLLYRPDNTIVKEIGHRIPWPQNNVVYTRYADDLTFSFIKKPKAREIRAVIRIASDALKPYGHRLNKKKTRVFFQNNRMEVTGIVVNNPHEITVSKKYRNNLRAAIHQAKTEEDIRSLEGRISWIQQLNPRQAKKMQSQLLKKQLHLQSQP